MPASLQQQLTYHWRWRERNHDVNQILWLNPSICVERTNLASHSATCESGKKPIAHSFSCTLHLDGWVAHSMSDIGCQNICTANSENNALLYNFDERCTQYQWFRTAKIFAVRPNKKICLGSMQVKLQNAVKTAQHLHKVLRLRKKHTIVSYHKIMFKKQSVFGHWTAINTYSPEKLTCPLKNHAWKTILFFWKWPLFRGIC